MTAATTTTRAAAVPGQSTRDRITKSLLGYGVLAGPVYIVTALMQAATRNGFDITRHPWSQLALGGPGWIQTTNFIVTGLMVVAAAVGLRRALDTGTAAGWAPALLAVFGLSLVAAGAFEVDPGGGFPIGASDTGVLSTSGLIHFGAGAIGFSCLFAGLLVLARRLRGEGFTGWATACRVVAPLFLVSFLGMASGMFGAVGVPLFVVGVVAVLTLLSLVFVQRYRQLPDTH